MKHLILTILLMQCINTQRTTKLQTWVLYDMLRKQMLELRDYLLA